MVVADFYTNGEYLKKNPGWHVDASPWKADSVLQVMRRNHLKPKTICEVGCGAGEILRILQQNMDKDCTFWGYEIAPQAVEMAKSRENERLHVKLADFMQEREAYYDLILLVDVLEHFEDIFGVLRQLKNRSEYKILQLPLDVSVASILQNELVDYRHATGHLHFFTKDIALEILRDNGYEVLDHFYALPPIDTDPWSQIAKEPGKLTRKLLRVGKRGLQRLPGNLLYKLDQDLAVRIFGGWRLMVLVK